MSENSKLGFQEGIDSLTGYEELAIKKSFGEPLFDLFNTSVAMAKRAVIFALTKRDGVDDREAKKRAMSMKVSEVNDYFAADEDESDDEDEPLTEMGKDDSANDETPEA